MTEFLQSPLALGVLLLAVLAALVAVGVFVISKVRNAAQKRGAYASELMTNFQELHDQGELSDEEYRTIKAMLAERLQDELNDTGETG